MVVMSAAGVVTLGTIVFNIVVMYNIALPSDYSGIGEAQNINSDDEARYTSELIVNALNTPESTNHLKNNVFKHYLQHVCDETGECITPEVDLKIMIAGVRSLSDIESFLHPLDPQHTLVFNLVESVDGVAARHPEVADTFDKLGFAYTGPNGDTLRIAVDKALSKERFIAAGLNTPLYQVIRTPEDQLSIQLLQTTPQNGQATPAVIIKPLAEDASIGISKHSSVVTTEEALRARVEYISKTYASPSLVEQFIDGREFTVGVWGNGDRATSLPLVECDFSYIPNPLMRIFDFETKWDETSPYYTQFSQICPPNIEPEIAEAVSRAAVAAFKSVDMRDFARVDVRVRGSTPYVLEVNPNPCLYPTGEFMQATSVLGYDFAQSLINIIEITWDRAQKAIQKATA